MDGDRVVATVAYDVTLSGTSTQGQLSVIDGAFDLELRFLDPMTLILADGRHVEVSVAGRTNLSKRPVTLKVIRFQVQ